MKHSTQGPLIHERSSGSPSSESHEQESSPNSITSDSKLSPESAPEQNNQEEYAEEKKEVPSLEEDQIISLIRERLNFVREWLSIFKRFDQKAEDEAMNMMREKFTDPRKISLEEFDQYCLSLPSQLRELGYQHHIPESVFEVGLNWIVRDNMKRFSCDDCKYLDYDDGNIQCMHNPPVILERSPKNCPKCHGMEA